MIEYENEPVRGLPERLPVGETMLWQGGPDWRALAIDAFHVRLVGIYFAAIALFGIVTGAWVGAAVTTGVGVVGIGVLAVLALLAARTTVYTLTDRRIVLRFGIALPKCVNLPLSQITGADLALLAGGAGNIALKLEGARGLGWFQFWPHVRAWRIKRPEPMLRAVPEAQAVAAVLARQLATIGAAKSGTAEAAHSELAVAA